MEEIEAKVLEIDPDTTAEALAALGAEQQFAGQVRSRFYDDKHGTIEENGVLRLREMGDKAFITRKTAIAKDAAKRMDETEFTVSDADEAHIFLESLGYRQIHESTKYREKWTKDNVEYVIDTYSGIPPLLEIEASSMDTLETAFNELGYRMDDTVTYDYHDLVNHYNPE